MFGLSACVCSVDVNVSEADACVWFLKFMSSHNANAFSFVNRTGRQTTRLFGMKDATTNDETHIESREEEEEEEEE